MSKRYRVPYKGELIIGSSAEKIAETIVKHGVLSYEDSLVYVKAQLKEYSPEPQANTFIRNPEKKELGLSDYVSGALAVVSIVKGSSVSQEEINRRAIICSSCPKLDDIKGCMPCGLAKRIADSVNKIKSLFGAAFNMPNGLNSKGCGVCKCALSVMLPSKMSQFTEQDQSTRPNHCWVKRTSNNFINGN